MPLRKLIRVLSKVEEANKEKGLHKPTVSPAGIWELGPLGPVGAAARAASDNQSLAFAAWVLPARAAFLQLAVFVAPCLSTYQPWSWSWHIVV